MKRLVKIICNRWFSGSRSSAAVAIRFGALLAAIALVGCAKTGDVYTTQPISASGSFETDNRLVGKWSNIFSGLLGMDSDFYFHHHEDSNELYAIYHGGDECAVTPIYTTGSGGQWFVNWDVRRSYLCTRPSESSAELEGLSNFKELYQLSRYQITVIPVDEVLTAAARFGLLGVEGIDRKSFLELKGELKKELGFDFQYSDLEIARQFLDRLTTFFAHLSEGEIKLAEIELLSIEPMSWQLTGQAIRSGRLTGHGCVENETAPLKEWNPDSGAVEETQQSMDGKTPSSVANESDVASSDGTENFECGVGSLVITDSGEKIRSLMLRTDESGLFPKIVDHNRSPHRDVKTTEVLDWRSSGEAFAGLFLGSWIRLRLSDSSQDLEQRNNNG